jgi:beta-galactosidase
MTSKKYFWILLLLLPIAGHVSAQSAASISAQSGRSEQELSGPGWSLWLDRAALWYNDSVYLPPVDIARLPLNPPTVGWQQLHAAPGISAHVPGTVEEHYWGAIGGAIPDTGGNYIGVSWWSRTFNVDPALKGKRITLHFQSVNLRAEVFVNGKLVGYDVVGNTPFDVDATSAIDFGAANRLDIRITDPVGNFEWNDNILMRWGHNLVPAVHGFGGITGTVTLRATDAVSVEDIYVQNQPDPHKVKLFVTLANHSGTAQTGELLLNIHEKDRPESVAWTKTLTVPTFSGEQTFTAEASVPGAKLWELSSKKEVKLAALYEARAAFTSLDHRITDASAQRFGFRWFDVQDKNHDPRFYLNGKRVFLIAAMTRGMWPKNGIFPTPEMARRDLQTMLDLGMNTMLMHRAIGQPMVMDYADSSGLFTYEEPGGYRIMPNKKDYIDSADDQARNWRREKLRRMILRDRSVPSMIIYNLKNEETVAPDQYDVKDMQMVHQLDPSRILTYNSGSDIGLDYHKLIPNNPFKLHMLPFNQQLLYDGWWDQHHWFGYSGYVDENYRNPRYYLRGVINSPRAPAPDDSLYRLDKKEIIFFGEEGAFGAIVRLQKIKEELDTIGATGYRELEHLDWYSYYNRFLDETGFRSAYPDVDSLTRSLGRNLHYFQARNIENVRLSNIADAYNMNGWASESTRTDVVDIYRHPTADASIIRYYTRPLYIAVKLRNKVVPQGAAPIADFYIINEMELKGQHQLKITLSDPAGATVLTRQYAVNIAGGEEFGQLLVENVQLPALPAAGYYRLSASLEAGGVQKTTGADEVYVVEENAHHGISNHCLVLEKDPIVHDFLKNDKGITAEAYSPAAPRSDLIIIGNTPASALTTTVLDDLLQRARAGARIIVLENADLFAQAINKVLEDRPPVYNGGGIIHWAGSGRLFVGKSALLTGLPQAQGMSWEYQCFYKTTDPYGNGLVSGIRLNHARSEWVAAVGHQGQKEILGALVRVPVGRGSVTLSTLGILPNLQTAELSAVVGKRLFLNMLE